MAGTDATSGRPLPAELVMKLVRARMAETDATYP
ncbi:MAG: hypothetical protein QOF11_1193 [Chloroflexota bacterium]|jgi:hypothetical protein|nr:hypothetical protein [Chloroflexota bacterium]